MTTTSSFYPLGLSETEAVTLDTFFTRQVNAAQLYVGFLQAHPARSLASLPRSRYFVRPDGLLAVFDPQSSLKDGWDFFDPKALHWTRGLDMADPAKLWDKPAKPSGAKPAPPAKSDSAASDAVAALDPAQVQKVLAAIGQTAADIVADTKLDKAAVMAVLRQLKAAGEVHTVGQGAQTRWVRRRGRPRTQLAGLTRVKRTAAKRATAKKAVKASPPERVLKALTAGAGLTIGEIANQAALRKPVVAEILRTLRQNGQVVTEGQRRGTRYSVADDAAVAAADAGAALQASAG